jgi:type IX secretion system PorP/SprF family membrane protein
MIKRILNILILNLCFLGVFAQNGAQFTHYVFNSFYLNPGAAGITNKTNIQANIRSQYTQYSATFDPGGSILSSVFSADLPLNKIKGGLGIYLSNQNFSQAQTGQELQIAYSHHKRIGINLLGIGVSAGFNNQKYFGENYRPRDPNDPFIPNTSLNIGAPDLNLGVFLFNPNYQLGISLRNLLEPKFTNNGFLGGPVQNRNMIFSGKMDFGVTYTLDVSPMFIVKTDFASVSTEVGMLASYNQKFWGGINYRWQDAASVMVGGNFFNNNVKVGYALDLVNFGLNAKSPTSQEIFLRYSLNPPRIGKKSIIKTPRYSL